MKFYFITSISWILIFCSYSNAQLQLEKVVDLIRNPVGLDDVKVFDLDGDGDDDLLLHGANFLICWSENLGNGEFSEPKEIVFASRLDSYHVPIIADLDGDGRSEVYARQSYVEFEGNGEFSEPKHLSFLDQLGESPRVIAAVPSKEGMSDQLLILSNTSVEDLYLYKVSASGEASLSLVLVDGAKFGEVNYNAALFGIGLLDYDGDGDMDLVCDNGSDVTIMRNESDFDFRVISVLEDLDFPGFSKSLNIDPIAVRVPDSDHPVLVFLERDSSNSEGNLVFRGQSNAESGSKIQSFDYCSPIINAENLRVESIVAMPDSRESGGEELWVRFHEFQSRESDNMPLPGKEILRVYRYGDNREWHIEKEVVLKGAGIGKIIPMSLESNGPIGIVFNFGVSPNGAYMPTFVFSENDVKWASFESLDATDPQLLTLTGPFLGWGRSQLIDLDGDERLDLVLSDQEFSPSYGGYVNERFELVYDVFGSPMRVIFDTKEKITFSDHVDNGGRIIVGDANVDELPDLLVSNATQGEIRLLINKGSREFIDSGFLISSATRIEPLSLDDDVIRYFDRGRVVSKKIDDPGEGEVIYDIGKPANIIYNDMDGDLIQDIVAFPCPLGNVLGWGKLDFDGAVTRWELCTQKDVFDFRVHGMVPAFGWVDGEDSSNPTFRRVIEGGSGVEIAALAGPVSPTTDYGYYLIMPPVDFDQDGDLDFLALAGLPRSSNLKGSGIYELVWYENLAGRLELHPERLISLSVYKYPFSCEIKEVVLDGVYKIMINGGCGEVVIMQPKVKLPLGSLRDWTDSYSLTGASSGPDSDPDGDGIPNFAEALQGTSPLVADAGSFSIPVAISANGQVEFSVPIDLATSGLVTVAEVSTDLQTWQQLDSGLESVGEVGDRFYYSITDEESVEEVPARFARLRFFAPD